MEVSINTIKEIAKLSRMTKSRLRKMNPERAYNGNDLTKYQLVYQIVFLRDAPSD